MSQDIINNHFLEESVFAIADGYCVINLTKSIVRGSMYQVVNGKKYNLDKNDGENNLHSGLDFYSFRVWKVKEQTENSITFALHSPDGDQNYPGELDIEVTYTLTDDNEIKIKLTLERIVSRIDIKFIKVASDDDHIEVPYATGNIFGGTGTTSLTSLIFTSSNVPLKYNLNGENPDYVTGVQCQVTYAAPSFQYGEANADAVKALDYQPFPKNANAINNNMETNIKKGIAKGGAYFMGSYLLPFPSSSQTLNANIQLNKANQERTIKVPGFTVTSNYVSIITVRLKSSTDAGDNNNGNDDEHLFNPKSTFIVKIEKTYDGIHNTNVDVE